VYIVEPAARPLIGYAVLRPKALDEGQVLFKPLDTFAFRDAEGVELNVAVAQPTPKMKLPRAMMSSVATVSAV
jgi:hypothetical protein